MILKSKFRGSVFTFACSSVFALAQTVHADEVARDDLITPPAMSSSAAEKMAAPAPSLSNAKNTQNANDVIVLNPRSDWIAPVVAASEPASKSSKKASAAKLSKQNTKEQAKANKAPEGEVGVLGGLYVYVDDMGIPHYSLQKLDDRYQLFANAGPVMDNDIKLAVGMPDSNLGNLGSLGLYQYGGGSAPAAVQRRLLSSTNLARFEATIRKHANTHGVDVNLVKAVMAAESGFNSTAISPKNAMGLMQVIPPTAARYGVSADQLMNPERNIYAGVRYLRDLSRMFQGRPDLIIAAYNAGEGAVYKYNRRIPPYAETQNYVRKVMQYYQVYNGSGFDMGSANMNVKIRTQAPAKKGKVVMTSAPVNSARRSMQRLGNAPVTAMPVVVNN